MAEVQIEAGRSHEVRIHINRQPYESPNPTTGAALYALGSIPGHYELFGEVDGDREDDLIPRNDTKIRLSKDEHFYSQKEFRIIVNARPKDVTERVLSFAQIVALAFQTPPQGQNVMFTITYRNGPKKTPEGTLPEGGTVKIKDGMIFSVTPTDKS